MKLHVAIQTLDTCDRSEGIGLAADAPDIFFNDESFDSVTKTCLPSDVLGLKAVCRELSIIAEGEQRVHLSKKANFALALRQGLLTDSEWILVVCDDIFPRMRAGEMERAIDAKEASLLLLRTTKYGTIDSEFDGCIIKEREIAKKMLQCVVSARHATVNTAVARFVSDNICQMDEIHLWKKELFKHADSVMSPTEQMYSQINEGMIASHIEDDYV